MFSAAEGYVKSRRFLERQKQADDKDNSDRAEGSASQGSLKWIALT